MVFMPGQKLLICVLDKVLIKRSRSKQKSIINRPVEQVDGAGIDFEFQVMEMVRQGKETETVREISCRR